MSKREELESKRDKLEKDLERDNAGVDSISLHDKSVFVAKIIKMVGNSFLFISIIVAVYSFIWAEAAFLLRIIPSIIYIVIGYILKVIFDAISLILLNLVELNNK